MKVVVQRVKKAKVIINEQIHQEIKQGFLLLVGITAADNAEIIHKVAQKIVDLRIFDDQDGKMNLGIEEIQGEILSVSQFTLYANCKKGRRPSFQQAARPEIAKPLYEKFNQIIAQRVPCKTGVFQAEMQVELVNDGPITIVIDSNEI